MNLKFYILKNLALINNDLEDKEFYKVTNVSIIEQFTSSTDKEYTGKYITIPPFTVYSIRAVAQTSGDSTSKWIGIAGASEFASNCLSQASSNFGHANIVISGYNDSENELYLYIFAQYSSVASNLLRITGFYIEKD